MGPRRVRRIESDEDLAKPVKTFRRRSQARAVKSPVPQRAQIVYARRGADIGRKPGLADRNAAPNRP